MKYVVAQIQHNYYWSQSIHPNQMIRYYYYLPRLSYSVLGPITILNQHWAARHSGQYKLSLRSGPHLY